MEGEKEGTLGGREGLKEGGRERKESEEGAKESP